MEQSRYDRPRHRTAQRRGNGRVAQLRIYKVRSAGRVSIDGAPITIGRSSQNTVVLRSTEVSRHHCIIEVADGVTRIRDLGSHHGISVNGEPVTESALRDGDRIRVGRFELTFIDPDEAVQARIESDAAEREAEIRQREAEAAQREAETQREDLGNRLTEAQAKAESLEADLSWQIERHQASQHEIAQRSAAADRVIRQFASHREQLLEAWQKLAVIHHTLTAVETLWVETDEQTQDAEPADPQELQELLEQREAIADHLEAVHAARDAAMGNLQMTLHRLASLRAPTESLQQPAFPESPAPPRPVDRRRRKPFRVLGAAGLVLLAAALWWIFTATIMVSG